MKISVIVPSYNRKTYTARAVRSILAQTYQDIEILVIDDCSRDEEIFRPDRVDESRVRVIRHEVNRGVSAARNTGVDQAQSPLIAFLDSDDCWLPNKLEQQLTLFQTLQDTEHLLIYGAYYTVGRSQSLRTPFGPIRRKQRVSDYLFLHYGCMHVNTWLARKTLLERFPFSTEFKQSEDWDALLRMDAEGVQFIFDPVPSALRHVDLRTDRLTTRTDFHCQRRFLAENAARLSPASRVIFESILIEQESAIPSASLLQFLWRRAKYIVSAASLSWGQRIRLLATYIAARLAYKVRSRFNRKPADLGDSSGVHADALATE